MEGLSKIEATSRAGVAQDMLNNLSREAPLSFTRNIEKNQSDMNLCLRAVSERTRQPCQPLSVPSASFTDLAKVHAIACRGLVGCIRP